MSKLTLDEAIKHLDDILSPEKEWDCEECRNKHIALREFLQELQQYRSIGTVEECREAMQRQQSKKIVPDGAFGRCPTCGKEFNSELIQEYEIRACPWCGQAIGISE